MPNLDLLLLESVNQFSRGAPNFDVLVSFVTRSYLFKGGVMMTFIWWGWFRKHPDQENQRQALLSVLIASMFTLVVTRLLVWVLPHRVRPMHDMTVEMELPVGMPPILPGWSSFPSDHAALFGCLAAGMFLVSRRAGIMATLYCLVFILLPRVYTGLHYPSDLLAGYAIAVFCVWGMSQSVSTSMLVQPTYTWLMARPGLWYPLFFLLSFGIATLFDDLRNLAQLVSVIFERMQQGVISVGAG